MFTFDSYYVDQNEEFAQRITELEATNAQLNNQLSELQNGDSKKADNTKTEPLKKEIALYKKTEKDWKKKATADATLISKHEATIAAMILQSDVGSGSNKTSQKRGGSKQRKVANENESDNSSSEADAIVVAQKKTKKKRSRGKAAEVENNGSSSNDAKGRSYINVVDNLASTFLYYDYYIAW